MTARVPLTASLLAAAVLVACGGTAPETEDGTEAVSDEVIGERVITYFQKTVTTPGLDFTVSDLGDAEVPGWRKGTLRVTLGEQSQQASFYVTPDGRYLLRGEAVDLSVDPAEAVQRQIVLAEQPARGPAEAAVTMVEYSDFQCPYCKRAHETLEKEVLEEYGDRIRFVYKNFPLSTIHAWADNGALAAECAFQQGNDQFWVMYEGLFTKQADITADNFATKATEIATAGGLDGDAFEKCLESRAALAAVEADKAEAAALGVNSTPTFFINGRRLNGAQTSESFKQLIEDELAAPAE